MAKNKSTGALFASLGIGLIAFNIGTLIVNGSSWLTYIAIIMAIVTSSIGISMIVDDTK